MENVPLNMNLEDVICPICLDSPHNCVLLQCSSYEKGCRPFVCDTGHMHSNCLDRYRNAYGMKSKLKSPSPSDLSSIDNNEENCKPTCPLCRGEVNGWTSIDNIRINLNEKKRGCEKHQCVFKGTYTELQKHAQLEHPHARPSNIDPARQLDWENFQQSSEIIDVLSTIHSEVPRGVVLGDYVIEYGDDDSGDEFEDFPGDDGNWWTSCILYQVFDNLRSSRNRRSRVSHTRRRTRTSSNEASNSDESSVGSVELADEESMSTVSSPSRSTSNHRSYRRRRTRFFDN